MRRYATVDLGDSESALIIFRDTNDRADVWYLYEANVSLRNSEEIVEGLNSQVSTH